MPTNFWEEQNMSKDIVDFHEELMSQMALPEWMKSIYCPFCKKVLPLRSIRSVRLCFNTRNFGEVAVEILCSDCNKMDTVYYRTEIRRMSHFIDYLNNYYQLDETPLVEKDMYNEKYNCTVEEMIKRQGRNENDNDKTRDDKK